MHVFTLHVLQIYVYHIILSIKRYSMDTEKIQHGIRLRAERNKPIGIQYIINLLPCFFLFDKGDAPPYLLRCLSLLTAHPYIPLQTRR